MVAKDWAREGGVDLPPWQAALAGSSTWEPDLDAGSGATGLGEGSGEGILYGGWLCHFFVLPGAPALILTEGANYLFWAGGRQPHPSSRRAERCSMDGARQ